MQAKVNFVFSGHAHQYERSYPVYQHQAMPNAPVYFLIGNGGTAVGSTWIDQTTSNAACAMTPANVVTTGLAPSPWLWDKSFYYPVNATVGAIQVRDRILDLQPRARIGCTRVGSSRFPSGTCVASLKDMTLGKKYRTSHASRLPCWLLHPTWLPWTRFTRFLMSHQEWSHLLNRYPATSLGRPTSPRPASFLPGS